MQRIILLPRLMYVAITRARRRLYLSFAQSRMLHGQVSYGMASSFLRELPDNLLHWITPRIAQRNSFAAHYLTPPGLPLSREEKYAPLTRGDGGVRVEADGAVRNPAWRSGQAVFHTKFGEGVIVNLEGSGADARVQVNFRKAGVKWLALEYAKLTAL